MFKNLSTLTIKEQNFSVVAKQPKLVSKLRKLTLDPSSGMNFELDRMLSDSKTRNVNCKIFTAHFLGFLIGWAMLSKENSDYYYNIKKLFRSNEGSLFQVFISPKFRKRGIASKLFELAYSKLQDQETMFICPHDNKGDKLYSKFNYQMERL